MTELTRELIERICEDCIGTFPGLTTRANMEALRDLALRGLEQTNAAGHSGESGNTLGTRDGDNPEVDPSAPAAPHSEPQGQGGESREAPLNAARYRWLRDHYTSKPFDERTALRGDNLDTAIDEAMRK